MNDDFIWTLTGLSEKYENENLIIQPNNTYDFYTADNPIYNNSKPDADISYKLNSDGFRCDDFNKENTKDSILVAGCSNTFGLGIPYDVTWGNLLSEKTKSKDFYNLGVVAASIPVIVNNCFNFIEEFGRPKAIFILFPSTDRGTVFQNLSTDREENFVLRTDMNDVSSIPKEQKNKIFQKLSLIKNLEILCSSLSIPLFWSITEKDCDRLIKDIIKESNYFKNYQSIFGFDVPVEDDKHLMKYKRYWHQSRDGVHFGEYFSRFFSNLMYFKYNKDRLI
jgi:hypothetical protein